MRKPVDIAQGLALKRMTKAPGMDGRQLWLDRHWNANVSLAMIGGKKWD